MKCVRCGTENISSADYCIECRTPLRFRRRSERYKKRKVIITTAIVVVWVACFTFFFKDVLFPEGPFSGADMSKRAKYAAKKDASRDKLFAQLEEVKSNEQASPEDKGAEAKGENFPVKTAEEGHEIVSGTLTILDPWNREVASIRAAIVGDGWLAVPTRAGLGGATWSFQSDFGDRVNVHGGSWQEGTAVGMWQVEQTSGTGKSVGLAPWDNNIPANWLSLESEKDVSEVLFSSLQNQGNFTKASLPSQINEVGIFVQGIDVVGWSFGQWVMGAYLWNPIGGDEAVLRQNVSVGDFYNITFANGREERFSIALAANNETDIIKKIELFIEGFRIQPKLAVSDTPYYLLVDEIIKQLRSLTEKAIASGLEKQIVDLFDSHSLKLIGDINLFMDVVRSTARVYGYGAAIAAIEETGSFIVQGKGVNVPELNDIHLTFYQDWLQALIKNGAIEEGESVYRTAKNYYNDDPYIHLLGTELELLKGNWIRAEELLYQRNYPPELLDRYELLARHISDLKGQEGSIVVRFQPGSSRIPLTALLNGSRSQEFLVDTGASLVTIPSAMVDALGLEIVSGDHYDQRRVSTAGGVFMASEVVIDSIEVGGWVEYEVKALVMDIPEQPGLGLLGLNYLSRFKMDLRNEEGVMALTPR